MNANAVRDDDAPQLMTVEAFALAQRRAAVDPEPEVADLPFALMAPTDTTARERQRGLFEGQA